MPSPSLSAALARLAESVARRAGDAPSDGRLLARFVRSRDDAAFAELVRRLGPMVLGVCRRLTAHAHDADDAFQAAFVVLARRAADVRPREAVRPWLYGVAVRVAREARSVAAKRRAREAPLTDLASGGREPPDPPSHQGPDGPRPPETEELVGLVDEEVGRLPDHLRAAVVLCELGGLSRKDAAGRLGIPEGTLSSRLGTARKRLAARLRVRGVAPALGGLAGLVGVPADLAARAAAGVSPDHVPAAVAALSDGVLRMMLLSKLKLVPVAVALLAGLVYAAGPGRAEGPPKPTRAEPEARNPAAAAPPGPGALVFCRTNRLTRIDPAGTNEAKFPAGDPATRVLGDGLRLSPDGRRVAYLAQDPDATDPVPAAGVPFLLYVGGAGAAEGRSLGVSPRSFAWSHDGAAVAVTEFPAPGQLTAAHAVVDVKTKEKTPLDLPDDHYITDWSRDGKHFLTTRIWPAAGVYLVSRDGTERKHLTENRLPAGQYGVGGRLSPDGKRVLLTVVTPRAKEAEAKSELAVLTTATGAITPVADTPRDGDVQSYCWSPDGKRIAYLWSESPAGQQEIGSAVVVCDPDGKNATTTASGKGPGVAIVGLDWR